MKRNILLLSLFTFYFVTNSQIPQVITNLQSPNTAGLGLYGEIPVSLFTGIPEISIPIFAAPDKYNNFKIFLNYHAGGVRPDQHPGWVGTNWTLFAGGCITRTVKDSDDEFKPLKTGKEIGFFYNYSFLNKNDWNTLDNIKNVILNHKSLNYIDTQPDEFSFNFGNYTGKFYLNELGQWVVQCNKPVKVEFDGLFVDVPSTLLYIKGTNLLKTEAQKERTKTFNSFILTTEEGTKYTFGNNINSIEYSMPFFEQYYSCWSSNSWYLTKILYPNGKFVNFKYKRGTLINQMYLSYKAKVTEDISYNNKPYNCYYNNNVPFNLENSYNGELISPIYLEEIEAPDFKIIFTTGSSYELRYDNKVYQNFINKYNYPYDPRVYLPYIFDIHENKTLNDYWNSFDWEQLYKITITCGNKTIKTYNFHYNSAAGATGDPRLTSKERSFLMSIVEDNLKKIYFEYDNKDKLPPYLSNMTDHWGFFNNNFANFNFNSYYDFKEPNKDVMKYGSLIKITYPTGGTTEFIFEANQYSSIAKIKRWEGVDVLNENKYAGGLRINKIISKPNNNSQPIIKEYSYIKNYSLTNQTGLSSGVLGGQSFYLFKVGYINQYDEENKIVEFIKGVSCVFRPNIMLFCEDLLNNITLIPELKYLIVRRTLFSTQSVLPISTNSMGSHIGYSEVIEKFSDGSFTKYIFSNLDNGYVDKIYDNTIQTSNSPYQLCNSTSQERGNLLKKEVFKSDGKILQKQETTYIKSGDTYVRNIVGRSELLCDAKQGYFLEGTAYKINLYSMLLKRTTTSYFDVDEKTTFMQITDYNYNKYNQITNEITENSDGKIFKTTTFYPNELANDIIPFISLNNIDYTSFSNSVISSNCLNPVIAIESFVNDKFIKGIYNEYKLLDNNTSLLKKVYLSNEDLSISNEYNCSDFDVYGNPIQTSINNGTETVTYIWSYNGLYPIAKILNSTYPQIKAIVGESNLLSLLNSNNPDMSKLNILKNVANIQLTTYTYKPLVGMTSQTDPRGVTTYYEYDGFNRLKYIRDKDNKILQSFDYNYKQQ